MNRSSKMVVFAAIALLLISGISSPAEVALTEPFESITITNPLMMPAHVNVSGDGMSISQTVPAGRKIKIEIDRLECVTVTVSSSPIRVISRSIDKNAYGSKVSGKISAYDYANRLKARSKNQASKYAISNSGTAYGSKISSHAADIAKKLAGKTKVEKGASSQPTSQPSSQPYLGGVKDTKKSDPKTFFAKQKICAGKVSVLTLGPGIKITPKTGSGGVSVNKDGDDDLKTIIAATARCNEGDYRWPNGVRIDKECSWTLPLDPVIRISSQSGHGSYSVDGAEGALGDLAAVLDAIGDVASSFGAGSNLRNGTAGGRDLASLGGEVVDIPTNPAGVVLEYAEQMVAIGGRATEAANRWGEQNANAIVDFQSEVRFEIVRVECAIVEVCEEGRWVDKGLWPKRLRRSPTDERVAYNEQNVMGGDLPRTITRMWNRYRRYFERLAQFEANPCGCDVQSGGGAAIIRDPTGRRDCRPIQERIGLVESNIESQEYWRDRFRETREFKEQELRDAHSDQRQRIREAEQALETSRQNLGEAQQYMLDLLANFPPANASRSSRDAFQEAIDRAQDRVDAAQEVVDAGQVDLDNARARPNEFDSLERQILDAEDSMFDRMDQIVHAEGVLRQLRRDYEECVEAGGIR
ncbi:MAG: hypothetical protein JKX97_06890 [Candidatus Lindowbacteria bacterium]|nr:hypothetical protein [Candidatus Lindowbacteria bacterium]